MSFDVLDQALEKALYDWANGQLSSEGYQVVWAYQTAAGSNLGQRPGQKICELKITWIRDSDGMVDQAYVGDGAYDYSSLVCFTLQINLFTSSMHMAMASKLRKSLLLPTISEKLRESGLAVWKRREPNDLSAAEAGKYELRSQLEIDFSYIQTVQDSPGEIQKVRAEFFVEGEKVSDITIPQE